MCDDVEQIQRCQPEKSCDQQKTDASGASSMSGNFLKNCKGVIYHHQILVQIKSSHSVLLLGADIQYTRIHSG